MERRNTYTKQSLWTVTNYPDDPVNQSKLEANACSRHKARENMSERVMTCSAYISDWFRKCYVLFYTNH